MVDSKKALEEIFAQLNVPVIFGIRRKAIEGFLQALDEKGPAALRKLFNRAITLGLEILQEDTDVTDVR